MLFALQCINYAIASFIRVTLHPHLHTLYSRSRYSFPEAFLIDIPQEVTITQRPIYDSTTRGLPRDRTFPRSSLPLVSMVEMTETKPRNGINKKRVRTTRASARKHAARERETKGNAMRRRGREGGEG